MVEYWLSWSFVLNLITSFILSDRLTFDLYSFSSSTFTIINPDEVLIGFENCLALIL